MAQVASSPADIVAIRGFSRGDELQSLCVFDVDGANGARRTMRRMHEERIRSVSIFARVAKRAKARIKIGSGLEKEEGLVEFASATKSECKFFACHI